VFSIYSLIHQQHELQEQALSSILIEKLDRCGGKTGVLRQTKKKKKKKKEYGQGIRINERLDIHWLDSHIVKGLQNSPGVVMTKTWVK
jgi:hypothetical protein